MDPSPPPPKRVLLLTNSEHGQANVFLATSYALLTLPDADVEVHFASFPPIQPAVSSTSAHARRDRPSARPIVFHALDGNDMVTAWSRPEILAEQAALYTPSAVPLVHAVRRGLLLLKVMLPWSGDEFVRLMKAVVKVVEEVGPDVVAVDPAFAPGLTALRGLGCRFVVLAPNTIKDFAMPLQPRGEALWKYPCIGTPYPFPPPPPLLPQNTLFTLLSLLLSILLDPTRRALTRYLSTHFPTARLTTLSDLSLNPHFAGTDRATKFLVANLPEIEFPLSYLPKHIVPCGPMLRPARAVGEMDCELAGWLEQAEAGVVYINLGTHVFYGEGLAGEVARAVRVLLDRVAGKGVRVLWKIPRGPGKDGGVFGEGSVVERVLGGELREGTVRVVEWLEAEPAAVLAVGTVVCAVHHGGANSFLESVAAGVPQVILPLWMDTFDFARRAELLGIGRWGNRVAGTLCERGELGSVLIDLIAGERSSGYRQKARELAELCKKGGGGRVIAARHILAEITVGSVEGGKETERLLGPASI
ncbi:hypothetical protein C8A05DRAFT_36984 [Staphylotrichum tortipilum]|uniref:Uncharacterized protein n=1 Tax=Staphylotrichum tortipilum TaxID=2831512 RepID=A0AAN6MEF1_9PEZI|nr:hypothetical protein C8A05DRAFT_36984 [Staphylotrichum longicolle]